MISNIAITIVVTGITGLVAVAAFFALPSAPIFVTVPLCMIFGGLLLGLWAALFKLWRADR